MLIDDLLGWQHGGLSRRSRILLVSLASLPLMAINAGKASMDLPVLGVVDFGLVYPLVFNPVGRLLVRLLLLISLRVLTVWKLDKEY